MVLKGQKIFFYLFIFTCTNFFGLDRNVLIRKGGLGKIELGMQKASVLKILRGKCKTKVFLSGERKISSLHCLYNKGEVDLEFQNKRLYRIYIKDSSYYTKKGIKVGSKLSEVKEAYPLAELFSGYLEGYYISMREKSLGIYIDFDIGSIIYQDPKNYKFGFKIDPKDFSQIKDLHVETIIILIPND